MTEDILKHDHGDISVSRRKLLTGACTLLGACALGAPASAWFFSGSGGEEDIRGHIFKHDAPDKLWKWHKKAKYQKNLAGKRTACGICPNRCVLAPGDRSVCRSRVNMDGILYSLAYGAACAVHVDPVEKKPLYHFKPHTTAFSIAATGCSFRCLNCQNWQISQERPEDVRHYDLFPEQVVEAAKESGAASVAYTYSEATTWFEYMTDTARLSKEAGFSNLYISNGYINQKPLDELCGLIDAANVNLKSFSDRIYRKLNGGRLKPVLNTFMTMNRRGVHFEMTNLVVPGYVDDPDMVKRMCAWIVENLGPDHPLHFLRFFPQYRLDRLAPTPVATLTKFRDIAMSEGIHYVYVGNVPGHPGNNTWCHNCGKLLIERQGYNIPVFNIKDGRCRFCNTIIPGVWS